MPSIILEIIMRNLFVKEQAQNLRKDGYTYEEIGAFLNMSKGSVRNLCNYENVSQPRKRGPKFKIDSKLRLRVKRNFMSLQNQGEKINCSKIKNTCDLNFSTRTLQRHMQKQGHKYRKAKMQIYLSKKHKEQRVKIISDWIISNHQWEKTVFSDEKRFSLDGPDDWRTYVQKSKPAVRERRQSKGGGIMVWLMLLPNGILAHRVITGKFGSVEYINLLHEMIVPIIKLNFGDDFILQEDNSTVHKARKVKDFMKLSKIRVIDWPSKSPDLNIVEDIWKKLSDMVYDGPQFKNKDELVIAINNSILELNTTGRNFMLDLYRDIRRRLCIVLNKNGNLYNRQCNK